MTTGAGNALLYTAHFWPNEIRTSLWSADIKNYVNLRKYIPTNFKPEIYHGRNKIPSTYDSSLLAGFSGSKVEANLEHFHPHHSSPGRPSTGYRLQDFRTLDHNGSENPPGETPISNLRYWITISENVRSSALSRTLSKDRS